MAVISAASATTVLGLIGAGGSAIGGVASAGAGAASLAAAGKQLAGKNQPPVSGDKTGPGINNEVSNIEKKPEVKSIVEKVVSSDSHAIQEGESYTATGR